LPARKPNPAAATVRLHYLDTGLEVEVDLPATTRHADKSRLEQHLRETLGSVTRLHSVTVR